MLIAVGAGLWSYNDSRLRAFDVTDYMNVWGRNPSSYANAQDITASLSRNKAMGISFVLVGLAAFAFGVSRRPRQKQMENPATDEVIAREPHDERGTPLDDTRQPGSRRRRAWLFGIAGLAALTFSVGVFFAVSPRIGLNLAFLQPPNTLKSQWTDQGAFTAYNAIPSNDIERLGKLKAAKTPVERQQYVLAREVYRIVNPQVDAQLFITGQVMSVKTLEAARIARKLILDNKIDPETIKGVESKRKEMEKRGELGVQDTTTDFTEQLIQSFGGASKQAPSPSPGAQQRPPLDFSDIQHLWQKPDFSDIDRLLRQRVTTSPTPSSSPYYP